MANEAWSPPARADDGDQSRPADEHFTIDARASVPPPVRLPGVAAQSAPPSASGRPEDADEVTEATVGIILPTGGPDEAAVVPGSLVVPPPVGIPVPPGAPAGYRGYGIGGDGAPPAPLASEELDAEDAPTDLLTDAETRSWFEESATVDFRGWLLRLPDGAGVLIDATLLIGRSPDASLGPSGARLVAIDDPARTVSRSHLLAGPGPRGELLLRNISTLNALVVIRADGAERKVPPGGMTVLGAEARVLLGAYPVSLERL